MKSRSPTLYLEDILEAMAWVETYIKGMTYEEFLEEHRTMDAVLRNLQIIGEAARSVPQEVRDLYSEIPWHRMIGLRNITIHEYFGVDLSIIWRIITHNLPETKPQIETLLRTLRTRPV
jgi:uncharacterized protein with HEPN domain